MSGIQLHLKSKVLLKEWPWDLIHYVTVLRTLLCDIKNSYWSLLLLLLLLFWSEKFNFLQQLACFGHNIVLTQISYRHFNWKNKMPLGFIISILLFKKILREISLLFILRLNKIWHFILISFFASGLSLWKWTSKWHWLIIVWIMQFGTLPLPAAKVKAVMFSLDILPLFPISIPELLVPSWFSLFVFMSISHPLSSLVLLQCLLKCHHDNKWHQFECDSEIIAVKWPHVAGCSWTQWPWPHCNFQEFSKGNQF